MSEKHLINPRQFTPAYERVHFRALGRKVYRPVVGRTAKSIVFKTASLALGYARRVHARWCRLYDAAVVAKSTVEEA